MAINFKEIPPPIKDEKPDSFELFSRDFFEALGYKIIKGPGRGPDKGTDLIISEERGGINGTTTFQYTVSCKHNAHSGAAVGDKEGNFSDRVVNIGSDGFIGFYSTLASESLISRLEDAKSRNEKFKEYTIYDYAKIEKDLLKNEKTLAVYKQHLRASFDANVKIDIASKIYSKEPKIHCFKCKSNLLENLEGWKFEQFTQIRSAKRDTFSSQLINIGFCCNCCKTEKELELGNMGYSVQTYWRELSYYTEPKSYIRSLMEGLKFLSFHGNYFASEEVAIKWNRFYLIMFYYVSRKQDQSTQRSFNSYFEEYQL